MFVERVVCRVVIGVSVVVFIVVAASAVVVVAIVVVVANATKDIVNNFKVKCILVYSVYNITSFALPWTH